MPARPAARQRLADLMERRRLDLGLTWREVAEAGNISYEVIRAIRHGAGQIRPLSKRGIEVGLGWAGGSVESIIDGGDPVIAGSVTAAPEPSRETPDSGDDAAGAIVAGNGSTAVLRAAVPATVRQIWTRVRRELAPELFADARQARAWPPGSAPLEVTPEVETILDAMRDSLFPGQVENAASRLVRYTWPERVMVAAASLDVLGQRPTVAVSRAG